MERAALPVPIVVTGPAGSGKSKLAAAIGVWARCTPLNIGTLMERELSRHSIAVNHRRDIGPVYLQQLGQQAYVDLVVDAIRTSPVVDGVRLAVALKEARRRHVAFFHVARTERPGSRVATSEPFAADVYAMQDAADSRVGWMPTVAELDRAAADVVAEVRGRACRRAVRAKSVAADGGIRLDR